MNEVKVEIKDNFLILHTPYHQEFVEDIKKINHRYWDGQAWRVQITHDKKDAIMALYLLEKHFDYKTDISLPDVPFGVAYTKGENLFIRSEFNRTFNQEMKKHAIWDSNEKAWCARAKSMSQLEELEFLIEDWNIKTDDDVKSWFEEKKKRFLEIKEKKRELLELSKKTEADIELKLPEGLKLYPFQKVGVQWLEKTGGRALIADEMGLGKTCQTLAWLYQHPEIRPVIVVCPSSVKINWKREIRKWCREEPFLISGRNGEIPSNYSFYIINYDILADRLEQLENLKPAMVVLDESHHIKNFQAKRTNASIKLCKNAEKVVCLTGTPLLNRPKELWTTLQILRPPEKDLRDFWAFMKKYADARRVWIGDKLVWDMNGASNLDELNVKLRQTVMIRRLKKDVLEELPEKRRIIVPLEISNREEYNELERNFLLWYHKHHGKILNEQSEILVRIEKLRQVALKGKYEMIKQFITDLLENHEKVVVFAHHRNVIEKLAEDFNGYKITGGMTSEEKQKILDKFRKEGRILIASIKACGEGINLEYVDVGVMIEVLWTPSRMMQAEDRLHRIGQKKSVDIYYLLGANTIDEYMWEVIKSKERIITEVVDGVEELKRTDIVTEVANIMLNKRREEKVW